MITFKFICNTSETYNYIKQFCNVKRVAYNLMKKDSTLKLSDVEKLCKNLNNINLLDTSFIKVAVNEAKSLPINKKIIFSKNEFLKLKYKNENSSKENYNNFKNSNMLFRGSKSDNKGNRKFSLDIENNKILFKPKKGTVILLDIIGLSSKRKNILLKLQELCEDNKSYFTIRLQRGYVSITFDDNFLSKPRKSSEFIKNRILSLDFNPNSIGVVISDNNKIVHKEIIDHLKINDMKQVSTDKRNHEKIHSSLYIIKLAKHYKCEYIATEDLKIKSSNKGKGGYFNKLCNNVWNRDQQLQTLYKHALYNDIKVIKILPYYSSFVGCLKYENEFDSVAAAIEIGDRATELLKNKIYKVLPEDSDLKLLSTHWKKTIKDNNITTWKELYIFCKNNETKHSYRFLFNRNKNSIFCFRLQSYKSLMTYYNIQ